MLGIELNPYAAELARVTVWIWEIQWMLKNGYPIRKNPMLQPLDHIENRDAVLNADRSEAQWPSVDAIIGNPPFFGLLLRASMNCGRYDLVQHLKTVHAIYRPTISFETFPFPEGLTPNLTPTNYANAAAN